MNTRRSFIKTIGTGAALSGIAFAAPSVVSARIADPEKKLKPIRVGIIGAENSHAKNFGKMFNIDHKFPGVEVTHIWGETDEFARKTAEAGNIPNIVKEQKDMLGKIDALIVDHRHAKYHLEAATPFVKAGIPTFVDKPFCYRVEEGKKFLEMARTVGTPVTSFSSIAQSVCTYDIKQQVETMGEINHVVRFGPVDLDSEYGGVFFYGVHILQPLLVMFGDEVQRVKITRDGKKGSAALVFKSGLYATLIFKNLAYGWETFVETKTGLVELKSRVPETDPIKIYTDIVEMFRTRVEPRSHHSILNEIAILEALERSASNEKWEDVIPV
jgi:predicted dehydrogenase